ncbi:DUF551 domain-containing protein [Escherichia coli]|nr:DUF551 domain-containing protein [Escherichia coli]
MSEIDKQALREAAANAKIAGEEPVMPFDQRITALNDFMKHCSPATVLALLDELEAAEKRNALAGNSPVTPDSWISCSERMPEKGQNVLISVNFDSSLVEPLICSARYTGSTFRRGDATIKPGNGIEQATHWMPLPEPPQEVNRG